MGSRRWEFTTVVEIVLINYDDPVRVFGLDSCLCLNKRPERCVGLEGSSFYYFFVFIFLFFTSKSKVGFASCRLLIDITQYYAYSVCRHRKS